LQWSSFSIAVEIVSHCTEQFAIAVQWRVSRIMLTAKYHHKQRCSRLVRKTLSFSKKTANHVGAIWYYIHDHNARQRAKLAATTYA
jgi:hypothetical protein